MFALNKWNYVLYRTVMLAFIVRDYGLLRSVYAFSVEYLPWERLDVYQGLKQDYEFVTDDILNAYPCKKILYFELLPKTLMTTFPDSYKLRCHYNAVNFLPFPHNRHPWLARKGKIRVVCCEFEVWFTLCCCNRSAVGNIVIKWTAL